MKKEKKEQRGIEKAILLLNKYYLVKPISTFAVALWLPFVIKNWGGPLSLIKVDGTLNRGGLVLTSSIYIFAGVIAILSAIESKTIGQFQKEIDVLKNNLNLHERIIKSTDAICDQKFDTMIKKVEVNGWNAGNIFKKITEPEAQLKAISKEIEACFNAITKKGNYDIVVSMAYSLPSLNTDWKWIDYSNMHGGFTPNELLQDENSAFYQIYSKKDYFIFYNDKLEAVKANCYVLNNRDKKFQSKGSIICMDIPAITENGDIARIILSISTYGFKIAEDSQEELMGETIEQIILKRFCKRIRIELVNLYIKNFHA